MILSRFINDLDRIVTNDIVNRSTNIGQGGCANIEAYREMVGINKGMRRAVDLAREMLRQHELAEDEKADAGL